MDINININTELVELYALEQKATALRAELKSIDEAIRQKTTQILNVETNGWEQEKFFAPAELLEQGVIARVSASYEGCDIDFLPVER